MKCTEVEIWLKETSEEVLINPNSGIKEHLQLCEQCEKKRLQLLQAYNFMNNQASKSLSEEKTQALLENLKSTQLNTGIFYRNEWLMRIAAVLVVALGVLLGVFVGNSYLFTEDEDAYWTEEFAVLTDTSNVILFE